MTNGKLQAYEDLKRLAKTFRGIFDLGEQLAEVGSLEEAASTAERRVEVASAAEAQILRRIGEEKEILSQVRLQADNVKREAATHAAQVVQGGNVQAGQIVAAAQEEAKRVSAEILASGQQAAKEAKALHEEELGQARAELGTFKANVSKAQAELGTLQQQITERKLELGVLAIKVQERQKAHDDARAQLEALKQRL